MGLTFINIYRSTHLRYGLLTIIYFVPALYLQFLSEVDTKDSRILLPSVLVYLFTYVHQLLLNSPATPFRLPYPIDLLLTILELTAYVILWCHPLSPDQAAFLSLAVFYYINFVVLSLIGFLKLCDIINGKESSDLAARYDYLTGRPWLPEDNERVMAMLQSGDWTRNLTFLLPRCAAILSVYFMIGFGWSTIVIAPMRETASIPLRESKSRHPSSIHLKTGISDVWNVIVVGSASGPALESAVETSLLSSGNNKISCPLVTSWQSSNLSQKDLFTPIPITLDARAFQCPYNSDLFVTVNFTKLGIVIPSGSPGAADSDGVRNSVVQVMLGSVADDPSDVIRRTEVPVPLVPGINLVGFAKVHILQKFKRPGLSTFGLIGSYESYLIPEIVNLSPDPQVQTSISSPSPLISHSPDIATIRIIPLIDFADWRIIQEYRDYSVLKGFAIIGGLWTFFGGVIAFLFGKSMALTIFDVKSLSKSDITDRCQKEGDGHRCCEPSNGVKDLEQGYETFVVDKNHRL